MGDHPALTLVDAVSCLGAVDLRTDEWNLDLTGSQKALMLPPKALYKSVLGLGPLFWILKCRNIIGTLKQQKEPEKGQTPYTPAALEMLN